MKVTTRLSLIVTSSPVFGFLPGLDFLLHKIKFPAGLHEDISVIFQIYLYATNIYYEKKIIYLKKNRFNSIVNTLSSKRIHDYFKSWLIIKKILLNIKNHSYFKSKFLKYYIQGIYGLIAIMILNNININKNDKVARERFYKIILQKIYKFIFNVCLSIHKWFFF